MSRFGLADAHWEIVEHLALIPLKQNGFKVWVFGSRAKGTHNPFSDLDLLIEGPIQNQRTLLSSIADTLEESVLPIRVDLVPLNELAESYRHNVLKDRVET